MRTSFVLAAALAAAAAVAPAQFRWRDVVESKSLELTENGQPVFVYRYGKQLPAAGVPGDRARCCYLHPLVAPNGAVVSDDFPRDHYHHRGVSWMWPIVRIDGVRYDLWLLRGIEDRFEKFGGRTATARGATLQVENAWYAGDRKVVRELVEIAVHPLDGATRDLDFTLSFEALAPNIELSGSPDGKGYGGFNLRFAPRTETVVRTPHAERATDSDLEPNEWAEITANYGGKRATARITPDPRNPGTPNGWCLRNYGFLGVCFPGLASYKLEPARPLVMKYRLTLTALP